MLADVQTDPIAPSQLLAMIDRQALSTDSVEVIVKTFSPMYERAVALVETAKTIEVPTATHLTEMRAAGEMRKKLKAVRTEIERTRKTLGENALRTKQAIDSLARKLTEVVEPVESAMLVLEETAIRAEADRKAALKRDREATLAQFGIGTEGLVLEEMSEPAFAQLAEAHAIMAKQRKEAAEKAEADRIAKAKADAEAEEARQAELAKIRAENARLAEEAAEARRKADADREAETQRRREADAKARREREAVEAHAAAERRRAEAAERELAAKEQAEQARAAQARREQELAAQAPDAEKIVAYADALMALPVPECTTEAGKEAAAKVASHILTLTGAIKRLAGTLTT